MMNRQRPGLPGLSLALFVHCQGREKEQRAHVVQRISALATELVGARVGLHRCPILHTSNVIVSRQAAVSSRRVVRKASKVNLESLQGESHGMNQGGIPPYTYLHNFSAGVWDQVNVNVFSQWNAGDFNSVLEQRDTAIAVHCALEAQAKHVSWCSVGFRHREGTEEAVAAFEGLLETDVWDLTGRRMYLMVVIALDFFPQDTAYVFQGREVFEAMRSCSQR